MTHFLLFSLLAAGSFGAEGTVVPGGSIVLSHSTAFDENGSFTNLYLAPEVSYFVLENFAVGAGINFGIAAAPGFLTYSYGAQPILGYYLPISDALGLFPKAALRYTKYQVDSDGAVLGGGYSDSSWSVHVAAPLLFHFGNFFLGFGPQYDRQLRSDISVIAFVSSIGGSF